MSLGVSKGRKRKRNGCSRGRRKKESVRVMEEGGKKSR